MRFEFFVGLRYLWNTRRTRFLSLITVISVLGITIGVASLVTVQSIMDGLQNQMKRSILGSKAHALVSTAEGTVADWMPVADTLRAVPGVAGVTPMVTTEVIIAANEDVLGGIASGVDVATVGSVILLPDQMAAEKSDIKCLAGFVNCPELLKRRTVDPRTAFYEDFIPERDRNLPPIVIGKEMARFFSLKAGDVMTVISPTGGGMGPTGPLPLSKNFRAAGTFFTGMYEYDLNYVYLNLTDAQDFFSMKGSITALALKFDDLYDVDRMADKIRAAAGAGYTLKTWKEMNKNIFNALKMEKIVMFLILGFIVLVASFNIVATLLMMVLGKTREIAILKAMGASNRAIMTLFVFDGFILGLVGTILGLALGFGACVWLDGLELSFAQDVYYLTTLPVEMSAGLFALCAVAALIVSFAATLYPSRYAARIRPAEGLRYE